MSELLPCPFCGSAPAFEPDASRDLVAVTCEGDDCNIYHYGVTEDEAARRWNRRPSPAPKVDMGPCGECATMRKIIGDAEFVVRGGDKDLALKILRGNVLMDAPKCPEPCGLVDMDDREAFKSYCDGNRAPWVEARLAAVAHRMLLSSTPPDPSSAKKYTPPDDESSDWWCTKNHRNGCHLQTCSVCGRKPGDTK